MCVCGAGLEGDEKCGLVKANKTTVPDSHWVSLAAPSHHSAAAPDAQRSAKHVSQRAKLACVVVPPVPPQYVSSHALRKSTDAPPQLSAAMIEDAPAVTQVHRKRKAVGLRIITRGAVGGLRKQAEKSQLVRARRD